MGAKVVVNYHNHPEAAEAVVEQIRSAGGEALAVKANVSEPAAAQRLMDETLAAYGRIDILVNNAGVTRDNLLMRMSEQDWDTVMDINLKGAFNCLKSATKPMMKQRYGRVVNITSVSGLAGNAGQANYSAAKAGLVGLTKAVAKELGSRNITINAVAPGFIETELTAGLADRSDEDRGEPDAAGAPGAAGRCGACRRLFRFGRGLVYHRSGAVSGRRLCHAVALASIRPAAHWRVRCWKKDSAR